MSSTFAPSRHSIIGATDCGRDFDGVLGTLDRQHRLSGTNLLPLCRLARLCAEEADLVSLETALGSLVIVQIVGLDKPYKIGLK
jgi:hypothetical protein